MFAFLLDAPLMLSPITAMIRSRFRAELISCNRTINLNAEKLWNIENFSFICIINCCIYQRNWCIWCEHGISICRCRCRWYAWVHVALNNIYRKCISKSYDVIRYSIVFDVCSWINLNSLRNWDIRISEFRFILRSRSCLLEWASTIIITMQCQNDHSSYSSYAYSALSSTQLEATIFGRQKKSRERNSKVKTIKMCWIRLNTIPNVRHIIVGRWPITSWPYIISFWYTFFFSPNETAVKVGLALNSAPIYSLYFYFQRVCSAWENTAERTPSCRGLFSVAWSTQERYFDADKSSARCCWPVIKLEKSAVQS